jgi:hypothetical protein
MNTNDLDMLSELSQFSRSASRNHIAFVKGNVENLDYVDLGYELSLKIEDILTDRRLSMKAQDYLKSIIMSNIHKDNDLGEYIAIKNIGILFEPELNFSLEALFNSWSQNTLLIVDIAKGKVDNKRFFLEDGCPIQYSVDLKDFNYLIIQ